MILEKVDRLTDKLDRVGRRCEAVHPDVGVCHRHNKHVEEGEPWHHALTGYDALKGSGDYWRWRD